MAPSFSSLFISPISDIPLAKNTPHLPALAWVEHSGSAAHISFLIIYLSSGFAALLFQVSGSCFPTEDFTHIFDGLYCEDRFRHREEVVLGLGLAIAKSIEETNDGNTRVENNPARGTPFIIQLPLGLEK
ncbi:ATP-binding protein [Chloroflexota bacterium]